MNPADSVPTRTDVLAELHRLRREVHRIDGSVVATTDGLVIAHDLGTAETYGVEPAGVAALAAVGMGLSQRIADTANHGELRDSVVRGSMGQVVTYAAGERALLAVLVSSLGDLTSLHAYAPQLVQRLVALLAQDQVAMPAQDQHEPGWPTAAGWRDPAGAWQSMPPSDRLPRRIPSARYR